MKGKIIPIIVFLLFTFSILDVVFGLQQSVITDLQKKLKTLGYYTGETHGKLDEATMAAIKEGQKICSRKDTGQLDKKTCVVIHKTLKEKEQPLKEKGQ
jgi:peptidoglycan hydrolase-like protein with peptidoglycan-binding domain